MDEWGVGVLGGDWEVGAWGEGARGRMETWGEDLSDRI